EGQEILALVLVVDVGVGGMLEPQPEAPARTERQLQADVRGELEVPAEAALAEPGGADEARRGAEVQRQRPAGARDQQAQPDMADAGAIAVLGLHRPEPGGEKAVQPPTAGAA